MPDLDLLKDVVKESSELYSRGQHSAALRLIDDAIARASQENRFRWTKILSQHAAAISSSISDIGLMRRYCEQIVNCDPENAMARFALADALLRHGEIELAREHAIKSYAIVVRSNSKEDRELVELIMKTWPDIGANMDSPRIS